MAENSLLTKHVVATDRSARDAGSTPAASTSLRSERSENEDCRAAARLRAKAGVFELRTKKRTEFFIASPLHANGVPANQPRATALGNLAQYTPLQRLRFLRFLLYKPVTPAGWLRRESSHDAIDQALRARRVTQSVGGFAAGGFTGRLGFNYC